MAVKREVPKAPEPRTPTHYSKSIKAALLYSNDFDTLLTYLRGRAETVRVIAGESAYIDSGADLRDLHPRERRKITITTTSPTLHIVLYGSMEDSHVETRELANDDAKALVDDVATVMWDWRSLRARLSLWWIVPTLLFAAFFASIPFRVETDENGDPINTTLIWVFVAVTLVLGTAAGFGSLGKRVLIRSSTRGESRDSRTRWIGNLAIGLGGGVAGAIATYLIALQDR